MYETLFSETYKLIVPSDPRLHGVVYTFAILCNGEMRLREKVFTDRQPTDLVYIPGTFVETAISLAKLPLVYKQYYVELNQILEFA